MKKEIKIKCPNIERYGVCKMIGCGYCDRHTPTQPQWEIEFDKKFSNIFDHITTINGDGKGNYTQTTTKEVKSFISSLLLSEKEKYEKFMDVIAEANYEIGAKEEKSRLLKQFEDIVPKEKYELDSYDMQDERAVGWNECRKQMLENMKKIQ